VIGRHIPRYREMGIDLVHQVHDAFVVSGHGVIWKMKEDLSGPYPGYGFGALDALDGYVSYRGREHLPRPRSDQEDDGDDEHQCSQVTPIRRPRMPDPASE
jgi:hypothetical protein